MENSQEQNCQSNSKQTPSKFVPIEQQEQITETEISSNPNYRSPRFEFDAPRYTNFSSKKYRETRRLLNKIVLHKEESSGSSSNSETEAEEDDSEHNCGGNSSSGDELELFQLGMTEEFNLLMRIETSTGEFNDFDDCDTDWFTRFHPLHEPLRPMTPPGPLISPEKSHRTSSFRPEALLESIEKRGSSPSYNRSNLSSPIRSNQHNTNTNINSSPSFKQQQHSSPLQKQKQQQSFVALTSINTPSKGPTTRIGLRAKPVRILKGSEANYSYKSPLKERHPFNQPNLLSSEDSSSDSFKLSISSLTRDDSFHERYSRQSGPLNNGTNHNHYNPQSSPLKSPIKRPLFTNTNTSHININSNVTKSTISSPLRNSVKILPLDLDSWTNFPADSEMKSSTALSKKRSADDSDPDTASRMTAVTKKKCLPQLAKPILPTTTQTQTTNSNFTASPTSKPVIKPTPLVRPSRKKPEVDLNDIKNLLKQHNSRLKPNHFSNSNNNKNKKT